MAEKIELEIVTPTGRMLQLSVDEVTAPSVHGEFGVLPGHLPLLAALHPGIVTYRQGSEWSRCAIGSGFAEVGPEKVTVLIDKYVVREKIDPVLVRKALSEIQEKISRAEAKGSAPTEEDSELSSLIAEENWLAAQLELYGDAPPATMRPFETYGPSPEMAESDVPTDEPVPDTSDVHQA